MGCANRSKWSFRHGDEDMGSAGRAAVFGAGWLTGQWGREGGGPTSGPTLIPVGHKSDGKGSGLSPGKAAATARAHDPRGAVYGLRTDGSGPAAPYRGL